MTHPTNEATAREEAIKTELRYMFDFGRIESLHPDPDLAFNNVIDQAMERIAKASPAHPTPDRLALARLALAGWRWRSS